MAWYHHVGPLPVRSNFPIFVFDQNSRFMMWWTRMELNLYGCYTPKKGHFRDKKQALCLYICYTVYILLETTCSHPILPWSENVPSPMPEISLQPSRPVNLHPLFLKFGHPAFWKSGTMLFEKNRVQKTNVIVIQKEKRQPGLFSFWIKNDPVFFSLLFANSRVPDF